MLDKIKEKYSKYLSDPSYVYKYCRDELKRAIIILDKSNIGSLNNPILTNENRIDVVDSNYAKFRANYLKVVLIFDIDDPDIEYDSITNQVYNETVYRKNQIIYPDKFDKDLEKVCSNGIHYFKTIDATYYYQNIPNDYIGTWYSWYENGSKRTSIEYVNGQKNGNSIEWYSGYTGSFPSDKGKQAIEKSLNFSTDSFSSDKGKQGLEKSLNFSTGQKMKEGKYFNNEKHGKFIRWFENGNIVSDYSYKIGKCTTYYNNGNKELEEEYVDDKKNGKCTSYYENGQKDEESNIIEDKLNGTWTRWKNGRKSEECEFLNNERHGKVTFWYNNGKIRLDGEYLNDKKHGKWTYYTFNGKKSHEKDYLEDRLIKTIFDISFISNEKN